MAIPLHKELLKEIPEDDGDSTYKLIYFVGVHQADVRRAVILDLDDDDFDFHPEVEDFNYEILQNVSLPEAIYESEIFFQNEGVAGYKKNRIIDPEGQLVGYELRPTYYEAFMGVEDLLVMSYKLHKDKTISINIRLRASLKRLVY